MNVLSLFDGMSCGRLALERAGVPVTAYYASEIDKYAMKVAKANYPDTIHIGDVEQVSSANLPDIDILIGGSPCQGFSFAGKQLNFDDPRSRLFFEYVRLLKECNPKYFLLENVVMKQEYQDVISEALGVEPIFINSSLVSAQSRKRLYWTNIPGIEQPEDKGIVLQDILEDGFTDRDKSFCIDACYYKGGDLNQYFNKHRRTLVFREKSQTIPATIYKENAKSMLKRGKFGLLVATPCDTLEPKVLCVVQRGRYTEDGVRKDGKGKPVQRLEARLDGKTNTLTTVQKDNAVADIQNLKWRKLTPLECERLQTVPEGYTNHVSNTQRYRMLGNGWTVDVIAHMFKNIAEPVRAVPGIRQASIFDFAECAIVEA